MILRNSPGSVARYLRIFNKKKKRATETILQGWKKIRSLLMPTTFFQHCKGTKLFPETPGCGAISKVPRRLESSFCGWRSLRKYGYSFLSPIQSYEKYIEVWPPRRKGTPGGNRLAPAKAHQDKVTKNF